MGKQGSTLHSPPTLSVMKNIDSAGRQVNKEPFSNDSARSRSRAAVPAASTTRLLCPPLRAFCCTAASFGSGANKRLMRCNKNGDIPFRLVAKLV
jgi:hypothetical protein